MVKEIPLESQKNFVIRPVVSIPPEDVDILKEIRRKLGARGEYSACATLAITRLIDAYKKGEIKL